MRALLLAALKGRLPLGTFSVNVPICKPSKSINNTNKEIYRVAGTPQEGKQAATLFSAFAHHTLGNDTLTLCTILLKEGKRRILINLTQERYISLYICIYI